MRLTIAGGLSDQTSTHASFKCNLSNIFRRFVCTDHRRQKKKTRKYKTQLTLNSIKCSVELLHSQSHTAQIRIFKHFHCRVISSPNNMLNATRNDNKTILLVSRRRCEATAAATASHHWFVCMDKHDTRVVLCIGCQAIERVRHNLVLDLREFSIRLIVVTKFMHKFIWHFRVHTTTTNVEFEMALRLKRKY